MGCATPDLQRSVSSCSFPYASAVKRKVFKVSGFENEGFCGVDGVFGNTTDVIDPQTVFGAGQLSGRL